MRPVAAASRASASGAAGQRSLSAAREGGARRDTARVHVRIGMRWWLALAFALIAAVTAVAVAQVFSKRSENAFQARAQELAVGQAVGAADAVDRALERGDLP